jgi:hypothetical protein
MKKCYQLTASLLFMLPLCGIGYAVEPQHPVAPPPPPPPMHHPDMGMGGMGGMSDAEQQQHFQAMQAHMLMMHDLSNKILAEQDPAKKEQLKNQQLEIMQAHHKKMMSAHHPMK